ncbi:MAG: UDP-N-acetylmuramoyl-L-alanyl-D-glutamate--2,6-diaminopimelate ligase [Nocardioides sp.]
MTGDGDPLVRPRTVPATTLGEIVTWLADAGCVPRLAGPASTAVSGLSLSSQRVRPGDLYVGLPGARTHGARYAEAAVAAGAVAVLTDAVGADWQTKAQPHLRGPMIVVEEPRGILGPLSAWIYGEPTTALRMIGVTGTQGKTTTTWLAESGLQDQAVASAVVGTVGTRIRGRHVKTALTTPEATDLHALFAVMREQQVDTCLMEVSSHALVLGRVDGITFDVAVFTNLGRDHLDFHRDIEDYFAAKASLFTPERARLGVVNLDDPYGRRLVDRASIPIRTFSAEPTDQAPIGPAGRYPARTPREADWQTTSVTLASTGSVAVVRTPTGAELAVHVPMPGRFNVANAVAAVAACGEAGIDPELVVRGLRHAAGVPGRMEPIAMGQDFGVVVDYAHKPDALRAALSSLREATNQRLIVVFGAGGDRDPGKRPLMGRVAGELADMVIITDDNPRSENPADIRAQIRSGMRATPAATTEIGDRRRAIERALTLAEPGDLVLIAGKGHESGQEVAGVMTEFDDRMVVREVLAQ